MPIFDRVQLGIDRDRATSQRINNKRKELGLPQAELARRLGVSQSRVSFWCRGGHIQHERLQQIDKVLYTRPFVHRSPT